MRARWARASRGNRVAYTDKSLNETRRAITVADVTNAIDWIEHIALAIAHVPERDGHDRP